MSTNCFLVKSQEESTTYLERCLRQGGTVGHLVADMLVNWTGRGFLLLPEDSMKLPNDFLHGGVCKRNEAVSSLSTLLLNEVLLHLQSVVFEQTLAKKGDPFLQKIAHKTIFYGDEVYFVLDNDHLSKDSIQQLVRDSSTAQGFTAFLLPRDIISYTRSGPLPVIDVAASLTAIIVGVFDNETFLFWKRDQ